jgi:hypothetical protein
MLCDGQTVPADTARKTCPAFLQLFGLCAWTKTYEASLRDRTTNKKKTFKAAIIKALAILVEDFLASARGRSCLCLEHTIKPGSILINYLPSD